MKNRMTKVGAIVGVLALSVVSMATPPAPVDYSESIEAFQTSLQGFFTTNGPGLLVALGVSLIFGIVWKLIKRAAKSV